jgi:hypothetical protein
MKRIATGLAAIAILATPILSYAQQYSQGPYSRQYSQGDLNMEYDVQGPPPYNDVEDGQLLKLLSYAVMPVGYVLEHCVTRPLHSLATDSPAAPVLSGDTQIKYFGESSNANLLPPDTFRPFQMPANPTQMDTGAGPLVPASPTAETNILPAVRSYQSTSTTGHFVTPPQPLDQQTVIH